MRRRSTHSSVVLLVGIVLTLVAVLAHQYLPERRLTLDAAKEGAVFFLMSSGEPLEDGSPAHAQWIDQRNLHFACRLPKGVDGQTCSLTYLLYTTHADRGIDLSRFRTLDLTMRYAGVARYVRVSIRNFDPRFSRLEDANSSKFNAVNLLPTELGAPLAIKLDEFAVPEWWQDQYDLQRTFVQPDLGNATAITFDLLGDLAGTPHELRVGSIEFRGDWISAEHWYLGILCLWMVIATVYGVTTWVALRRRHREQRQKISELVDSNAQLETERERYRRLSTLDALTRVLNRHGIEQFVGALPASGPPLSVIVIDLDHFKRINDHRGHHIGDRVLQTVGEILRTHTRASDGLGRWGGEEFVLVCPATTLAQAADHAEKLRHRILQTNFIAEDPLSVTASLGVATAIPDEPFDETFRRADQALYLAKSRGRNCVVAATEEEMHTVTGARKGKWALISGRFKLHK